MDGGSAGVWADRLVDERASRSVDGLVNLPCWVRLARDLPKTNSQHHSVGVEMIPADHGDRSTKVFLPPALGGENPVKKNRHNQPESNK